MATSNFPTKQYDSEHFVESAGAVIFDLANEHTRICLIYSKKHNEWYLPKGRRNHGESRAEAAVREATEETGVPCRLLPICLKTRAPPQIEPEGGSPDIVRIEGNSTEPFMITLREIGDGQMKLIWWYVAEVDIIKTFGMPEAQFRVQFFEFKQALEMLTFQTDREVVERAIKLFHGKG